MTIKITSATFSACITSKEGFPADNLPIIALVGRSNVGKSSLINALTGRRELARTSSMPGKTLTINFYCINDSFYIVDLPGYGYAKASKNTRAKIQLMMNEFFCECKNLKGVVQVLDIRHRPTPLDFQMYEWIREQHLNGFVVLTKTDKLSNQQVVKMRNSITRDIRGVFNILYSSKNFVGREEFLDAVEKVISGFVFKVSDNRPAKRVTKNEDGQRQNSHKSERPDKANPQSNSSPKPKRPENAGGVKKNRPPRPNKNRVNKEEEKK